MALALMEGETLVQAIEGARYVKLIVVKSGPVLEVRARYDGFEISSLMSPEEYQEFVRNFAYKLLERGFGPYERVRRLLSEEPNGHPLNFDFHP